MKMKSETMRKLNIFAGCVAELIDYGIKHNAIGDCGEDMKSEIKQFICLYKPQLSYEHNVNVANICKTPKQLNFVCGLAAWKLKKLQAA